MAFEDLIPQSSIIMFGAQVGWDRAREGKVEKGDKDPKQSDCPECGGLFWAAKGEGYVVEGLEYTFDDKMPLRFARIGDPGYFFLPDGRVVQPAEVSERLLDSELIVCSCARCSRVLEKYRNRLRGLPKGTGNLKRLSHRAARIIGKPEASLNSYISAAEKLEAEKAKKAKGSKGSKAAKPRKTAKAADCSRKPRGASWNSPR
jgi:hypothetical protein